MYNRIRKNMPAGILAAGFIISSVLMFIYYFVKSGYPTYQTFIFGEYLREAAYLIITECVIASVVFRIFLKKKYADPDSGQKG